MISNDPNSLHQNPSPSIGRGARVRRNPPATINETSYPLYDAHGNMTAQLLKNGTSFTVANEKSYDAWGGIRAGNSNPEYKGRYCATLGHTQDDESSLIYMRARYYEPSSGRFVSEDSGMDGTNWVSYSKNDPINYADQNGKLAQAAIALLLAIVVIAVGSAGVEWFKELVDGKGISVERISAKFMQGAVQAVLTEVFLFLVVAAASTVFCPPLCALLCLATAYWIWIWLECNDAMERGID